VPHLLSQMKVSSHPSPLLEGQSLPRYCLFIFLQYWNMFQ
jgi:hypothetical protein